jgi:hypothetical protein
MDGRLSGYTIEADTSYLWTTLPTLTYRMYARDRVSGRNLDEFCRAMSGLGAELRAWRLLGTVARPGGLVRTEQVCVSAGFAGDLTLGRATALVRDRFTRGGPDAVPGSWRFPDVRVTGGAAPGTMRVWAHRWGAAVALTLSPNPPAPDGVRAPIRVLACWSHFLTTASATAGAGPTRPRPGR